VLRLGRAASLALLALAAILFAFWIASPSFRRASPEQQDRRALLDELQPVALENCTFGRFGGSHDTGFVMCKNLVDDVEAAYSYGTTADDDWACDVSRRYRMPVHYYGCVVSDPAPCETGELVFHAECLGGRRQQLDTRSFDTLANQVASNGHTGRRLLVKIDVEGPEWESLMASPDEVLERIEQLAIEFHGASDRGFVELIRKLKRNFYIVNLHFDNNTCSEETDPLPARAYEVLFVNKRIARIDPTEPGVPLPSPLNAPDNPDLPDCQPDIPDRDVRERRVRQALLDELRPVALRNCTLERFGSEFDGGYLMCGNLIEDLGAAYSYGVGPNDEWGCDVSTRFGVPVHQYDCFDPARPQCSTGRFVFHAECIGDRRESIDLRPFDTLSGQVAANGDTGKRLIMKIDVEGAEWDALMATPEEVLERVDQLPMELHGVDQRRFLDVVRKLKRSFHLVSVHFNNFSCDARLAPFPARAYQVLFVNKRLGILDPENSTPPPSPLLAPDNPRIPDCQLPTNP
jgi:hypothetical protein